MKWDRPGCYKATLQKTSSNINIMNLIHHSVWESDKSDKNIDALKKRNKLFSSFTSFYIIIVSMVILHPMTCRGLFTNFFKMSPVSIYY